MINGIYSKDGNLLAELEETDHAGYLRQLAGVVSLKAGDEVVLKIDGSMLTHTPTTAELWTDSCYGIEFSQEKATFTAKESILGVAGARPFNVYAKFWTDNNVKFGWTITMDDGERDPIVEGGAYLVGANLTVGEHTEADAWKLIKDFYINPEGGLKVTLTENSEFKVAKCVGGKINWDSNPQYKMADGYKAENYLNLPGSDNGKAWAPGEYTITVDVDTWTFTFTPGEDVEPDEVQYELRYFIKGKLVTENWQNKTEDKYELKQSSTDENIYELTIDLAENDEFMFNGMNVDVAGKRPATGANQFIKGDSLEEGITCVTGTGNMTAVAAGTYTFTYNATTQKLSVTFEAESAGGDEAVEGNE